MVDIHKKMLFVAFYTSVHWFIQLDFINNKVKPVHYKQVGSNSALYKEAN